ncbi:PREDICTED: uncharacterized protein LOC105556251, partial [Vollenhovia emeryi]|uniref:uncharacterized protein LOC105556251 n=1 Tax=Vollenhovia emeryi TaxID=411798 RepID=UPI0005F48A33
MSERMAKQRLLQRSIERAMDNFKKIGKNNVTPAKIRTRIASLKEAWSQYQEGHATLTQVTPAATQATLDYFTQGQFESTEDVFTTTWEYMAELLEEMEPILQTLRDKVNHAVAALKNLTRKSEELWNDTLVHLIVQKLDPITRKAWNVKVGDTDDPPSYDDLKNFLTSRARALEDFAIASSSKAAVTSKVHTATASAHAQNKCPLCKSQHFLNLCPKFISKSASQRREIIKQHQRCFNCLSAKHAVQACRSKYSCRVCDKKHHSMLHSDSDSCSSSSDAAALNCSSPQIADSKPEVNSLLVSTATKNLSPILLATAWVTVRVASGRTAVVRALLDQGSEMTFISQTLAQTLRAKRLKMPISVSAVGGINAGTFQHVTNIFISSRKSLVPSFATTALILKSLTSYTPKRNADISSLSYLSDLPLADADPTSSDPISIIIGADLYSDIILDGVRKGGPGTRSPKTLSSVEELPRQSLLSPQEKQCEEHFCSTHSRDPNGRYVVRLPFKETPPLNIGSSRFRAEKLLHTLTRRFHDKPEVAKEYHDFLSQYELLGHMRPAPLPQNQSEQLVYLSHHGVIREDSSTTHLRVVFNASSVTSNGTSLNDHLHAGPKLQTDITSIILQWRRYKYVYSSDIAKMYRQIRVDSRDINYQRILWKPLPSESVTDYQLLTVTYGMACAPYLALRVLKQLVVDEGRNFPLAVPILRDNIYVDDVLFGADDPNIIRKTRDQLIALLTRGGFELHKWASNSPSLLDDIDIENHGLAGKKPLSPDERLNILGIGWHPATDVFEFRVSLDNGIPSTKRTILSAIAKFYDPLGWVTPVTITAKTLMQNLWRIKLEWDERIPETLLTKWREIYSRLRHLGDLQITRWTGIGPDTRHAEIQGFADASNKAYAAVVYVKIVSASGQTTITLLIGKSKVAPLKYTAQYTAVGIVCVDGEWRHVPTEDNPADCASRGMLGNEILEHSLWWHGPSWLHFEADKWPCRDTCTPPSAPLEERVISLQCSKPQDQWDLAE